jgi:HK97 family phage portal protein
MTPDYTDHYLRSAWVHTAISRIAEAAALIPYHVYQLDGERKIPINNHPLEQLLRRPNPTLSGFELMESTFGFLELNGNAYWYLAADSEGRPAEIWVLRPDRVRLSVERDPVMAGYLYTVGGSELRLTREQVIHFKRWHPRDEGYGLSSLSAAASASVTDQAMQQWNLNLFSKQNVIPAGIVSIKNMIPNAEFERIQREWTESYRSTDRRTAFIRGAGEIEWSGVGLNQMESDFLNGRRFNRDEILHIFGIPSGLFEKDATRANAIAARQTFLEQTIYPKLVRVGAKMTQELVPFFGQNLVIEPEKPGDVVNAPLPSPEIPLPSGEGLKNPRTQPI